MFVVQLSIWIQTNYYSDLGHSYIFHREYLIQLNFYNHFSDITRKDHVLWPPSICPTRYLFGRMEAKDRFLMAAWNFQTDLCVHLYRVLLCV